GFSDGGCPTQEASPRHRAAAIPSAFPYWERGPVPPDPRDGPTLQSGWDAPEKRPEPFFLGQSSLSPFFRGPEGTKENRPGRNLNRCGNNLFPVRSVKRRQSPYSSPYFDRR